MKNFILKILSIIWMLALVLPDSAHAYIDPGTGALVLQIILAAIAGTLFFFKTIRDKIVYFIKKPFQKKNDASEDSGESSENENRKE